MFNKKIIMFILIILCYLKKKNNLDNKLENKD